MPPLPLTYFPRSISVVLEDVHRLPKPSQELLAKHQTVEALPCASRPPLRNFVQSPRTSAASAPPPLLPRGRPPSEGLTFISRLRQPCTTGACPSRFKIHGATPPSPMAIRIASLPPPPPWTCLPGWAPGDVTATTAWLLNLSASSAVAMGDSGSGVQLLRLSRPISLTRVSGISPSCPCRIVAASFSGPPLVAPKMGLDSVLGSSSRFSGAVGLASPG